MAVTEVRLAKTAGFCFGVKRAVDKVYEQVNSGKKNIYTFGPIIHNEQVVKDLEEKGVHVITTEEELKSLDKGTIIIRSHGVSKKINRLMEQCGLEVIDATCPFVKKIHRIVEEDSGKGNAIVIVGSKSHPEVEGIVGWCQGEAFVVESPQEAEALVLPEKAAVTIVSQTTFNYNKFKDLVEIVSKKGYNIFVVNTICNATQERQIEARQIASGVEAMIVIGSQASSNTQKLFEICKKECKNTYHIQTFEDLTEQEFRTVRTVGITAGASTPKNIIEEVHTNVRIKF